MDNVRSITPNDKVVTMVDNRDYKIIGILGLGAIILAFLLIPINNSRHVTATDVSNDQPPIFLSQTINNSGGGGGNNTSNGGNLCMYNIFQNESSGNPRTIYAVNCKTGIIDFKSTNASSVFNSVMTQVNANNAGVVHVKGYGQNHAYNITTAIILPNSGHLFFYGDGMENTVLQIPVGSDNDLFDFLGSKSQVAYFNTFAYFEGYGNLAGTNNRGFFLNSTGFGMQDSLWSNVFLRNFKQDDLYLGAFTPASSCWNNRIESSVIELAGRAGLYLTGTNLVCQDTKVLQTKFLFNNQYGIFSTATLTTVTNGWFYKTNQTAIKLNGASKSIIDANRFLDNGIQTDNTYSDVWVLGSNNVINDNRFAGADVGINAPKYGILFDTFENSNVASGNTFDSTYKTAGIFFGTTSQLNNLVSGNNFNGLTTPISGTTTNDVIRDNYPNTVNTQFINGTGIIINHNSYQDTVKTNFANGTGIQITGTTQQTFTNTGVISNSCSSGISCSGTNPSSFTNTGVTSLTSSNGATSLSGSTGAITETPKWQLAGQFNLTSQSSNGIAQNSGTATTVVLNNLNTATAEHVNAGSALIGTVVNAIQIGLLKTNTPTGTLQACILDNSNNCTFEFNTIDVSKISTSLTTYIFFNNTNSHTMAQGDRIGFKYTGGTSTNTVSISVSTTDVYDTTKSELATFTSGAWGADLTQDLGDSTQGWHLTNDPISLHISSYKNLLIVFNGKIATTGTVPTILYNNDTVPLCSTRFVSNGGASTTLTNNGACFINGNSAVLNSGDIIMTNAWINNNLATDRKSTIAHNVYGLDTDMGTAPSITEAVCKYSNTSIKITNISIFNADGTGAWGANSYLTVWGFN